MWLREVPDGYKANRLPLGFGQSTKQPTNDPGSEMWLLCTSNIQHGQSTRSLNFQLDRPRGESAFEPVGGSNASARNESMTYVAHFFEHCPTEHADLLPGG